MPLTLTGRLTAVQFCYPAELPLTLNKLKRFITGSYIFLFHQVVCNQSVSNIDEAPGIVHDHLVVGGKDEGDAFLRIHLLHYFQ